MVLDDEEQERRVDDVPGERDDSWAAPPVRPGGPEPGHSG
jgi:hypothetical protein